MIVDLGTGDGRAVLGRASEEPRALVIGIDANAAAMAESSRRAARSRAGHRPNAIFLVEAAEALPGLLAQSADEVTITMPWGSLLRGVLGLDQVAMRGVESIVGPGGRIEALVSVVQADGVEGLAVLDRASEERIVAACRSVGFELQSLRPASVYEMRATRSSWARRLGDRPVWRLDLCRAWPAAPTVPRAHVQDRRH